MKKYTTAKWIMETLNLNVPHALYREDGIWYHHLERFPGILFDSGGYLIIQDNNEYINHTSFRRTKALSVKNGISNIQGYIKFTEDQKNLLKIANIFENTVIEEQVTRKLRQYELLQRNRKFIQTIKSLYDYTCQLCNTKLKIRNNLFYSEVHHIQPLGMPHNGPDIKENMICVCPNCHIKLDLGGIQINLDKLHSSKHKINLKYVDYHNSKIFNHVLN